jgi:hypothetical protein
LHARLHGLWEIGLTHHTGACFAARAEGKTMYIHRRKLLELAGAVAAVAGSRAAWAETYPSRPVRILVGYAAGGGLDLAARLIGQWLSERLGQQFVVENRTGAGRLHAALGQRRERDQRHLLREPEFQFHA